jgi:ketosteroid isomerase-like protein
VATVATTIAALEAKRCAALVAGDREVLAELISDDLVHVHGTGALDGKAGYLQGIGGKYEFHEVTRGKLDIRDYGDFAIVTGTLHQSYSEKITGQRFAIEGITTQTWICLDGSWRQNTCHNSFLSSRRVDVQSGGNAPLS